MEVKLNPTVKWVMVTMPEPLARIYTAWLTEHKTGSIQLNFIRGTIPNVNVGETVRMH